MVLRFLLVLQIVFVGHISRAQILEEMTVQQLGDHVSSLIDHERILEAYDQFYTYTNFTPGFNKRMRNKEELLAIQKLVEDAKIRLEGTSIERLFDLQKSIILEALEAENYQKALLITAYFKDSLQDASKLYRNIEKMMPKDTIQVYRSRFPLQLYSVPQMGEYYNPAAITENTLVYSKNDSTLFSGVIISRDNDAQSMETEIAGLNYDRYENGKRVERKYEGYILSNPYNIIPTYFKNQLFFGHDSSHFRLYHRVLYNNSDTIRKYFYGHKEELINERVELNPKNGGYISIREVEYNTDGSIKKWKELAPISEKHKQYDSYWCWVNQFGDTIHEEFTVLKDNLEINQERKLNEKGDTIYLSRTINSFLDGLQIEKRESYEGLNFELRYVFDKGKLLDVLSDSVVYFDMEWNIILEEDYIELMNQDNDDYSYFYSGIFKEYFPDSDFKTDAYFLAVSDIGRKNYKPFKKSVKKYFRIKI